MNDDLKKIQQQVQAEIAAMNENLKDPRKVTRATTMYLVNQDPAFKDAAVKRNVIITQDPNWIAANLKGAKKRTANPQYLQNCAEANRKKAKDERWQTANKEGAIKRSNDKKWQESNKAANQNPAKIAAQKKHVTGENSKVFKGIYVATDIHTGDKIKLMPAELKPAGFSPGLVSECCNGKRKQYKGYTWSREKP